MNFAPVKTTAASQWRMIIGQWDVLKAEIGVMNSSRDEWHQLKHPGSVVSVVCLVVDFPSVNFFSFYPIYKLQYFVLPPAMSFAMNKKPWWWANMASFLGKDAMTPWHLWWNSKVEIKVCILTFITSRHVILWGQQTVYSWSFLHRFWRIVWNRGLTRLYFFIHIFKYIYLRERHRW